MEHFDVHSKSFSSIPHLTTFCSYGLVINDTVDGKDNLKEKTREVVDIRMYVSLPLDFSSTRMCYAVAVVVDMKVF